MRISVPSTVIDERFLNHRLRSTSLAGIIGGLLAIGLFLYRYCVYGIWNWDLFAVVAAIVTVKLAMMIWYLLTD
jgi:hypothetical protein